MNRTITTLFAILAGAALATSAFANGRHDENPHGYNAKVAASQQAQAQKPATLAVGPRAHDNPLRGKKIAITPKPEQAPATVTK